MKKFGVIDLGTNTFHLLIGRWEEGRGFQELYRERRFVKLGEEGLERIGDDAYLRGIQTVIDFKDKLLQYEVEQMRAIGTAALRTAVNGRSFIAEIAVRSGIKVEIIDGDEEARFIHLGVVQAIPFDERARMIMDIGGGSVELIIADRDQVHWARSFPVGVAVLLKKFHHSDPISAEEIAALRRFLSDELQPLMPLLNSYEMQELVGASGTFEVLGDLLPARENSGLHTSLKSSDFYPMFRQVLSTTHQERLAMENLPNSRADMFVVALLLLEFILHRMQPERISVSKYALKEGVLWEMLQKS